MNTFYKGVLTFLILISMLSASTSYADNITIKSNDNNSTLLIIHNSIKVATKNPDRVNAEVELHDQDGIKTQYMFVSGCSALSSNGGIIGRYTDNTYQEVANGSITKWSWRGGEFRDTVAIELCMRSYIIRNNL